MSLARAAYQRLYGLASAKLGRCSICMGLSLGGAVIGWMVLATVVRFWPEFQFRNFLTLWPASFTVLWMLHIVTFGSRSVVRELREKQRALEAAPVTGPSMNRRHLMKVFASSAALAIVASAVAAPRALAHGPARCCSPIGAKCFIGLTCSANPACARLNPLFGVCR